MTESKDNGELLNDEMKDVSRQESRLWGIQVRQEMSNSNIERRFKKPFKKRKGEDFYEDISGWNTAK